MLDTPSQGEQARQRGSRRVATNKTRTAPVTLRALRVRRGWTVRELAARAALPPATVSRLERGLMVPTYEQQLALSNAIGHVLRPAFVLCAEENA